ncbi:MAG: acetoacetate decarboxylase family protein [Candidatus Anammoxibacter sp.]
MVFKGMPICAPLVVYGPYIFKSADFYMMVCKADPVYIKSILPEGLKAFPMHNMIILGFVDYPTVYPAFDDNLKYSYNESVIFIPVRKKGTLFNFGLYASYICANNDRAIAAGREIYGFSKKFGETEIKREGENISVKLTRLDSTLIELKGKKHKMKLISFLINRITSLMPTQLLTFLFPKVFNYKYIPQVDGSGAQIIEVTGTKFKIDDIRQFEWLAGNAISIKLKGSKVDPLHKFSYSTLKPVLAFHYTLGFTLPNGKVEHKIL